MSRRQDVLLFSASDAGHRASYLALFATLFPSRRAHSLVEVLFSPNPALFLMIEESFGAYAAISFLRSLLGRRTAGLLFRPGPAVTPTNLRLRFKSMILRLLRATPRIHTITILPFDVDPRMAKIADNWIHDPQLWDLSEAEKVQVENLRAKRESGAGLSGEIRCQADNRLVVTAIGRQDRDKAFDLFARLYATSPALQESALFAYGGKVDPKLESDAEAFERAGGFAAQRFISDSEVLELYAAADLVWSTYAQGYDQASGIFGRAIQLGMTPIVRDGSLIHRQCVIDNLPHLAVTEDNAAVSILAHSPSPAQQVSDLTSKWRDNAIMRLSHALGLVR